MQEKTNQKRGQSLSELSSEILIIILRLRAAKEFGNVTELRQKISDLLHQLEINARDLGIDGEQVKQAKFALAAFIDETILNSQWDQKSSWAAKLLTLELFQVFTFGEDFFTRLDQLRQRTQSNLAALEVYYLCMTLGFKGKYQLQGPEQVRGIATDLYHELHRSEKKYSGLLSPHGRPREEIVQVMKERIPVWIVGITSITLGIIFYIIMTVLISSEASDAKTIIEEIL